MKKLLLHIIGLISICFFPYNINCYGEKIKNSNDAKNESIWVDTANISYKYHIDSEGKFHYSDMIFPIHIEEGTDYIVYTLEQQRKNSEVWAPYAGAGRQYDDLIKSIDFDIRMKPTLRVHFTIRVNGEWYKTPFIYATDYIAEADRPFINRSIYDPDFFTKVDITEDENKTIIDRQNGLLSVKSPNASAINLYNISGQLICKGKSSQIHTINTTSLTKGIYILKIENGHSIESYKITIP